MSISTEITQLFNIKAPVILAGMNVAAGPRLAAAVTNAGGLGVIGGVGYTPEMLREMIRELKADLKDKNAPFGVDLLLPQVGGSARKTNKDYTKGQLPELVDIIIEEKAALFISAVGVPPKWVVDKMHANGIYVMNMIGAPKHAAKALAVGVDIITAQGGEGGGHTGSIPTSILIPAVVDAVKGRKSPLSGKQVPVVAAGGMYNGRSLAAALAFGAQGVWVGTRFICAEEAGASKTHQEKVLTASYDDTIRSIIFTGRPLRIRKSPYIVDWNENRQEEIKALTAKGILPWEYESERLEKEGKLTEEIEDQAVPYLMGEVAAVVNDIKPAKQIVDEMVAEAVESIKKLNSYVGRSKL
ncbi:hypothetical protein CANCADRAFT_146156 [Tortispora caseinolytica NRRL Y-17796]|uniref:Uncharacterized protein n=1 Tax=Tortispora caseinolytica NRRL Y-17796 TaxID=767744 RepID=A0A1E4T9K0_9ASCO|nr:hypothetical protein CANCADRAFT_146156 [Tortispora caseinolytica NRRL Y-17796]